MRLIILIPAYNEEETIASVIKGIPAAFTGVDRAISLVVDDGSSDNTAAIAKEAGAILVSHSQNRGGGMRLHNRLNFRPRKCIDYDQPVLFLKSHCCTYKLNPSELFC